MCQSLLVFPECMCVCVEWGGWGGGVGFLGKMPSVREVWIFSGTAHFMLMLSFLLYLYIEVYWTSWPMCSQIVLTLFCVLCILICLIGIPVLTLFICTLFLFWNSYDSGSTSCKEKISAYKIPLCLADCLWSSSIYVQRGENNTFKLILIARNTPFTTLFNFFIVILLVCFIYLFIFFWVKIVCH